jgi:hypothetical protein
MATPIQLGWEAQMDNHAKLAVKCIQSRDFSPFQIIRAHDIISGIDHTVTLYAAFESKELAKEAEARIKGENIDLPNKGKGNYKNFSDKVEGLKDKDIKGQDPKVVKEDWEKMMDKEADDASERLSKFIDENKDKCVAYIYTLPEDAREPAANLWKNTLNVVKLSNSSRESGTRSYKPGTRLWIGARVPSIPSVAGSADSAPKQFGHRNTVLARCTQKLELWPMNCPARESRWKGRTWRGLEGSGQSRQIYRDTRGPIPPGWRVSGKELFR